MWSNTVVALPANALAGVTPPEKAKTCMPAARAASTPWMLSSTTAHSSGRNPKESAACRKRSGSGFPPPHVLGTENPAFESGQQPGLSQCSPYLAVGPAGSYAMRQPQPVESLFDSVHSTQVQSKRPLIPALISMVPTGRQDDIQVFFNLGDEVRFGFSNEPADYLVKMEIPAKISEDALVHPDGNGFGIHQDAVAIEDHQLEK